MPQKLSQTVPPLRTLAMWEGERMAQPQGREYTDSIYAKWFHAYGSMHDVL